MHPMLFPIMVYRLNHYSPHHKLLCNHHGKISAQTHQLPPKNSCKNLTENIILKTGKLTLRRKVNTHLKNYFYHFKIPA